MRSSLQRRRTAPSWSGLMAVTCAAGTGRSATSRWSRARASTPGGRSTASPSPATARRPRGRGSGRRLPRPGWVRTRRRRCCATAMPGCGGYSARRCRVPRSCWTGGTRPCASSTRGRWRGVLGAGMADTHFADEAVRGLDRAKWRLWHGRWTGCRRKLAALCRWTKRKPVCDVAGLDRVQRRVSELLGYLERNQAALVHYAARRRHGEPISTAFVESAVNEIVAKRLNKRQQMRWSRASVQPFLDVRTAVLNGTL